MSHFLGTLQIFNLILNQLLCFPMAGTGENELVMDEWRVSDPSPRTFFSSLMNGDLSSRPLFTDAGADNGGEVGITGPAKEDNETKEGVSRDHPCSESDVLSAQKPASRASLAERMAARTGFNAPKLNTDSIRSSSLPSPGARSPYLTIPPGLSPTTLLESPVFLCNSLTQQSPTTGKFPFGLFGDGTSSYAFEKGKDSSLAVAPVPFAFRPPSESSSLCFTNGENRIAPVPTTRHQSLPSIEVSVQSAGQIPDQNLSTTKTYSQNDHEFCSQQSLQITPSSKDINALSFPQNVVNNVGDSPPFDDEDDGDQKGEFSSQAVGATAEDGYNWRKYGQKQVKGSEFPRSYYKCTHINCPVKKKVERSHEGHVTEIIYKGAHNHSKPTPNRRSIVGSYQTLDEGDNNNNVIPQSLDGEDATWTPGQHGISNGMVDWMMNDGTNKGPSGSVSAEFCDPSLSIHGPGGVETADARDVSSTMSNENDDDDRATNGSVSLGCEDEEEESESKRRKLDVCVSEISGATRAIREPRVVVQTTSEVDILDDGYRWRKYGQKVVKGNPNPRSYYKCTNAGCTVRKHVERASHDLKSVITTYEGKHNHDVPAARNSSQINSTPSSAAPASSSSFVPRAEPSQTHGSLRMFDRSPILSGYNMHGRTQMTTPIPGYSFGMGQANLSSIAMAGLGSANHGKLPGFPMPHPYLGQQQHQQQQPLRKPNEWGLMMPKGEPNELPLESDLPVTNASAAYHQLVSRMALGPQL